MQARKPVLLQGRVSGAENRQDGLGGIKNNNNDIELLRLHGTGQIEQAVRGCIITCRPMHGTIKDTTHVGVILWSLFYSQFCGSLTMSF